MNQTHFFWKLFMWHIVFLESWDRFSTMRSKLREILMSVADNAKKGSIYHEHSESSDDELCDESESEGRVKREAS